MSYLSKLRSLGIAEANLQDKNFVDSFFYQGLKKGMGLTMGNCLRRVLLSEIPGYAIRACKIQGLTSQFAPIPGLKEDAQQLIMNLKKIVFKGDIQETVAHLTIKKGEIVANHVKGVNVEIVNKDLYIGTFLDNSEVKVSMELEKNTGIILAKDVNSEDYEVGAILCDAFFNPIEKVNFTVHSKESEDTEDLEIEVMTNGSVSPAEAHKIAHELIQEEFSKHGKVEKKLVQSKVPKVLPKALDLKVEELIDASGRVVSCLKANDINYVGQLVKYTEEQLLQYPNFGKSSLKLLVEKLESLGLSLGMSLDWEISEEQKESLDDNFVI